ncbi:hypothetical protein JX266_011559 [Neoarthrinium moseri]|uniref:uncharacterized protein n=1 Tax=Neoarthrinium moseri TaxID=1658444 RepID=UPI001FDE3392|nr:uncharacterized protein JN550_002624 [Neoarthrinium moseri]KAI1842274.1 hypothetical protein JX266_011559 [Neoarthrinium moseri]KAI1874045.1 hypothetical protein JN550_002624 [Neoarthrinium moseri]
MGRTAIVAAIYALAVSTFGTSYVRAEAYFSSLESASSGRLSARQSSDLILDQTTALDMHNTARANVGVLPLVWDAALEADAQEYANYIASIDSLVHSTGSGQGENLAFQRSSSGVRFPLSVSTNSWLQEEVNYNGEVIPEGNFAAYGHYTQYLPAGNVVGQRPYDISSSSSSSSSTQSFETSTSTSLVVSTTSTSTSLSITTESPTSSTTSETSTATAGPVTTESSSSSTSSESSTASVGPVTTESSSSSTTSESSTASVGPVTTESSSSSTTSETSTESSSSCSTSESSTASAGPVTTESSSCSTSSEIPTVTASSSTGISSPITTVPAPPYPMNSTTALSTAETSPVFTSVTTFETSSGSVDPTAADTTLVYPTAPTYNAVTIPTSYMTYNSKKSTYTSTYAVTTTYAINLCHPRVTNCSVYKSTTEVHTITTTWCPEDTQQPTVYGNHKVPKPTRSAEPHAQNYPSNFGPGKSHPANTEGTDPVAPGQGHHPAAQHPDSKSDPASASTFTSASDAEEHVDPPDNDAAASGNLPQPAVIIPTAPILPSNPTRANSAVTGATLVAAAGVNEISPESIVEPGPSGVDDSTNNEATQAATTPSLPSYVTAAASKADVSYLCILIGFTTGFIMYG